MVIVCDLGLAPVCDITSLRVTINGDGWVVSRHSIVKSESTDINCIRLPPLAFTELIEFLVLKDVVDVRALLLVVEDRDWLMVSTWYAFIRRLFPSV